MSMSDIKTEIMFGAAVAEAKEQVDLTHGDMLDWKKGSVARDLGMRIADEKGWNDREEHGMYISDIRLYVFTPNELADYMEAKFKARLRKMAATETYLTDEQRNALMIQSERF